LKTELILEKQRLLDKITATVIATPTLYKLFIHLAQGKRPA